MKGKKTSEKPVVLPRSILVKTMDAEAARELLKSKVISRSQYNRVLQGKPIRVRMTRLLGAGLGDWVKDTFSKAKDFVQDRFRVRDGYVSSTRKFLEANGHKVLTSLTVSRAPIQGFINTALNTISFGKWNELRQKYAYDKLFHLALIATYKDDEGHEKRAIIEKNEVINVSGSIKHEKDGQFEPVSLQGKTLTLNELMENAHKELGSDFFPYDPFNGKGGKGTNCQGFLIGILKGSGLLTPALEKFILQDITQLVKELPGHVGAIAKGVTDVGAIAQNVIQGGRVRRVARGSRRSPLRPPSRITKKDRQRAIGIRT